MTEQLPTINFRASPDGDQANEATETIVNVNVGINDSGEDLRAEADVRLYVNGERVDRKVSDGHLQDEEIVRTLTHTFEQQGTYTLRAFVGIDWYGQPGFARQDGDFFNDSAEVSETIVITQQSFLAGDVDDTSIGNTGDDFTTAFNNRTPVEFQSIVSDEETGASVPDEIEFAPNDNPDISVDTSGRFKEHEIIGGVTVRQKIGEAPVEISVRGVCNEDTAKKIDQLRNARKANFISDRISMTVHIASSSTSPLESGGAADMNTGDLLYSYNLNLVGLENLSI